MVQWPRLRALQPFARAFRLWSDAGGLNLSAAMSFYGILSLAPLLLAVVGILGGLLDREVLERGLVTQIGAIVGPQGASLIEAALSSTRESGGGLFASIAGFVVLFFGATGVFGELQEAFARLWTPAGVTRTKPAWWHAAALRLRGVGYVLVFGFLLLVSLVVTTLLSLFSGWVGESVPIEALLRLANELAGLAVATALFFGLMRLSSGARPGRRHLLVGAFTGAVLFTLGRQLLALYLAKAAVVSAYGAAGSLMVVLMWMYFSSAVLLLGASLARALQERDQESARRWAPQSASAETMPATTSTARPH